MNQLMAMNNEVTMTSREIAELVGKEHKHVMRDLRVLSEQLGDMFEGVVQVWTHPQNKQQYEEYAIKRDTCITLLTGYDPVSRMKVIKRWQELEEAQKPAIPQTYAAALLEAGRLALELEESEKQLAIAAPKADVFDKIVERNSLMNATQVGSKIGLSAYSLNKLLDKYGVYNKAVRRNKRTFKLWFIEGGYGEMKVSQDGYSQALFTNAGEMWVVETLTAEGVI